MFDNDAEKIGVPVGDIPVYSMEEMPNFLKENMPDIAVLALPRRVAQEALDKLYACGIRAVWNFAPTDLTHPDDMLVVNVHLTDSLQTLTYHMAHRNEENSK